MRKDGAVGAMKTKVIGKEKSEEDNQKVQRYPQHGKKNRGLVMLKHA
jgi:hypothetical protein